MQYDGKGDGKGLHTGVWDTSRIDVISDACAIPVEDCSFQNILCTEVLEHLPYPDRAIAEFARILKYNGRLILAAPFWSPTHFAPFHFCTGFSPYWYQRILADHGFEILEIRRNGNYFTSVLQEMVRTPFILRKYSRIGVVAYASFFCILPTVLVIYLLSFLTKKSEDLMCFSVCVLARRRS
jgi:SAM-dependent methyltransferase